MFTVEVEKLISAMKSAKRVCFIFCLLAISFIAYIGFKGVEYKLSDLAMAVSTVVPLAIVVVSGRWWEGMDEKKHIGIATNKAAKAVRPVMEREAYSSEMFQV